MSVTMGYALQPNEWSVIGPLARLQIFQVKEAKALRLHYGDIRVPSTIDTVDFIVTQSYDPQPMVLQDNAYYEPACLFAMPDRNETVDVVTVVLPVTSETTGTAGLLPSITQYEDVRIVIAGPLGRAVVSSGSLPPGLRLDPLQSLPSDYGRALLGYATTAGVFTFTLTITGSDGHTYSLPHTITVRPAVWSKLS